VGTRNLARFGSRSNCNFESSSARHPVTSMPGCCSRVSWTNVSALTPDGAHLTGPRTLHTRHFRCRTIATTLTGRTVVGVYTDADGGAVDLRKARPPGGPALRHSSWSLTSSSGGCSRPPVPHPTCRTSSSNWPRAFDAGALRQFSGASSDSRASDVPAACSGGELGRRPARSFPAEGSHGRQTLGDVGGAGRARRACHLCEWAA